MAHLILTVENGRRSANIVGDIVSGWQSGRLRGRAAIDYVNDTQLKVNLDVSPPNHPLFLPGGQFESKRSRH